MRRKYFRWAIAVIATLGPMQAWGGDREIAEQIIQRLKEDRDSGALKDFTLDMKVDQGVVLFRGKVSKDDQKQLVLGAAEGIEGIAKVVDEMKIETVAKAATKAESAPEADSPRPNFSFRNALAKQAEAIREAKARLPVMVKPQAKALEVVPGDLEVVPGQVVPASATEQVAETESEPAETVQTSEPNVTLAVVEALRDAQQRGELKGFGVDVRHSNGTVELIGRARNASQRDRIIEITRQTAGVENVRDGITIAQVNAEMPRLPEPPVLEELAPVTVENAPVRQASDTAPVTTMAAPYRMQPTQNARTVAAPVNGQMAGAPVGAPMMGQPVPVAPYGTPAGAPRYDSPYLPNYAWPGYAAYPNYAALGYPQQYSPTAFPYIGPFYPYPQVPLGWRKVSLEWDDGWWFLDFTDRQSH